MFWIGVSIFLCGAAIGAVTALILRRKVMSAIDDLHTAIDRIEAGISALRASSDPSAAVTAAVAANQATNDAAVQAATSRLNAIDVSPAAPAAAA